jgi:hypothetical protein
MLMAASAMAPVLQAATETTRDPEAYACCPALLGWKLTCFGFGSRSRLDGPENSVPLNQREPLHSRWLLNAGLIGGQG